MRSEDNDQEIDPEDGWGNDDLDLTDQTPIQSQTSEENLTPPSLPEEEGTA